MSSRPTRRTLAALALAGLASTAVAQPSPDVHRHRVKFVGPTPVPERVDALDTGRRFDDGRRPAIMLTGYWPPTNEMLREFSDDLVQNPGGWIGADWEGRGYDVYSYFPEFDPPDCGQCGQGMGDLEVDYQDTSADFWALADALQPVAVVTFSRGFNDSSWEVEMNQYNRPNWIPDFTPPLQPTPVPPDASVPAWHLRPSNLPAQEIVDAVDMIPGVDPYICFSGGGGGYLSEFIAYHGVWYRDLHDQPSDPAWAVAGGHVHVGAQLTVGRARAAAKETLRQVMDYVDQVLPTETCQTDVGFGGPGSVTIAMCGEPLAAGRASTLSLAGAPAQAPLWLALSLAATPTPFKGGQLVPIPLLVLLPAAADASGELQLAVPGGGGPGFVYLQAIVQDAGQPAGFALSNALQLDVLR